MRPCTRVVMVGGNAWGGLMTTCMKPHEDALFYAHVEPAKVVPARCCSPRYRMPFHSITECSECLG